MTFAPEIAIIEQNTLTAIGLQSLIEKMMPQAVVRTFSRFEELICDTPETYAHYFVSAAVVVEHTDFFLERCRRTIVLTNGTAIGSPRTEFRTFNAHLPSEQLTRALLRMEQEGHRSGRNLPPEWGQPSAEPCGLSAREVEVLVLIVRGLTGKEIADQLNISLSTVISHRKNLTEKLGIRSVSGLTIYAVMNGYIAADRI